MQRTRHHSKEEIEAFGVEPFIHKCLESVFRYTREWEDLTERLGFWIHLDDAYVTYHQSYVESVWWSLKNLFDRGLLYQGHKIVWWWAQGGTALSSGEVGEGYREVADPSVYVRFPSSTTPAPICSSGRPRVDLAEYTSSPAVIRNWNVLDRGLRRRGTESCDCIRPRGNHRGKGRQGIQRPQDVEGSNCSDGATAAVRLLLQKLGDVRGTLKSGGTEPIAWRVVAADL